jgi:RISC-loading complex subunit TARBP2
MHAVFKYIILLQVDSEEGLPHERLFAIACRVGDQFVEIGKGKSKKLAKRVAAHNMAQRLRSLPLESSSSRVYQDDDDIIIGCIRSLVTPEKKVKKQRNRKKSKSTSSVRSTSTGEPSLQAFEYKNMTGPVVDLLRDPTHKIERTDIVGFVRRLEKEQNFKAMYLDSDERSATDEYQCMVQLSLDPPLVLIGEGPTKAEAKRNAAFDITKFFAQMVRTRGKSENTNGTSTPTSKVQD